MENLEQPYHSHSMIPPGQPLSYEQPSEIKTVGILQLLAGIIYISTSISSCFLTCGFVFLAITPLFGMIVASLEIYNGAKALSSEPNTTQFWWTTLPILGIISIISGDFISCAIGIIALILLDKPQVKAWIQP